MTTAETSGKSVTTPRYDPFRAAQRDNPHPVWQEMRDHAQVVWSDAIDAWVVSRHEDALKILADTETYINEGSTRSFFAPPPEVREILQRGLPNEGTRATQDLDPPDHTRIRKFLLAIFTPRRVNRLAPRAREIAEALADGLISRGGGDFVADFAYKLPLTLLTELLGIPADDGERLHHWSTQKMALQWGQLSLADHIRAAHDYVDFQLYLKDLVERRRADPVDDVVSAFTQLRQHDERPMSDPEIVGQMMGLIAAGHETTMNFLSLTLWRVLEQRSAWERVCADPALIDKLVEEGLRIDSPAGIWRRTTRPVVLGGCEIPRGARVQVLLPSANRDQSVFSGPERMDFDRGQEGPHLAFGRGIHFCVGAALTRLEGHAAFETLAARAPAIRLSTDFSPRFKANASQRFLESLPVIIGAGAPA